MSQLKLFMFLLGAKPTGRNTEQHDVFFGIGKSPKDLISEIENFWPEAEDKIHVDAWREITWVDGFDIKVILKKERVQSGNSHQLFFINLGGYQKGLFDELHFKILLVQENKAMAIKQSKSTVFFQKTTFDDAKSHIDDKYGIDVDDLHEIEDILPPLQKQKFALSITPNTTGNEDEIHLGYFKFNTLP